MDCGEILRKYSRYLLIIFNFLFVLTGVIIIAVGASVKAYYRDYNTLLDDKYFYASDLLIITGVIIFIISFFGCCGALKENACMTLTFSTLLIAIFVLELVVGIGGFLLKNKTEEFIEKALNETMQEYGKTNYTEVTKMWDRVQKEFQCCGIKNYTDWKPIMNETLPISCCDFPAGTVGPIECKPQPQNGLYQHGCVEKFGEYIKRHVTSVEVVGLTFAIIQLLGIVLSCYLSKQIKSDYETV